MCSLWISLDRENVALNKVVADPKKSKPDA